MFNYICQNNYGEVLSTLGNGHSCVPLEKLVSVQVLNNDQN